MKISKEVFYLGGFQLMINIAVWAGIGYYAAKLVVVICAFKAIDEWFPSWGILKASHSNKWFLIGIDTFFGYIGAHLFNANNLGMVALISFTCCSAAYIIACLLWKNVKLYFKKTKTEQPEIQKIAQPIMQSTTQRASFF
jgi:hypothetical protein